MTKFYVLSKHILDAQDNVYTEMAEDEIDEVIDGLWSINEDQGAETLKDAWLKVKLYIPVHQRFEVAVALSEAFKITYLEE